jgi:hypothetical protein
LRQKPSSAVFLVRRTVVIDLEEFRQRKNKTAQGPAGLRPTGSARGLGFIHRKMSPFCDPASKRPCVTVCAPSNGEECSRDEERQVLIRTLEECKEMVTIGTIKAGCNGDCTVGPMVGFPHKEFFYLGMGSKESGALKRGVLTGGLLFDRLSVGWRRSYRSDIYYEKETGFLAAIDQHVCMVEVAKYFLDFEEGISCGKCVPCRVGVKRARESVNRLISGRGGAEDLERITTLCDIMEMTPNCDYASGAMRPVKSAISFFFEEFDGHVEGKCSAGVCNFKD